MTDGNRTVREVVNRAFEGMVTYRATFENWLPGAPFPTIITAPVGIAVCIIGAAGMVIRIKTIHTDPLSNKGQGQTPLFINKYSTAPTGGTYTNPEKVLLDGNNSPALATVNVYTVAPAAGVLVGAVFEDDIHVENLWGFRGDRVHEDFGKGDGCQAIVLRSAAEAVAIELTRVATPFNGYVEWTEEAGIATPTPPVS